jgi:hypothetical protein
MAYKRQWCCCAFLLPLYSCYQHELWQYCDVLTCSALHQQQTRKRDTLKLIAVGKGTQHQLADSTHTYLVAQEHGQPINTYTPSTCWWQPILHSYTEIFIMYLSFIITLGTCCCLCFKTTTLNTWVIQLCVGIAQLLTVAKIAVAVVQEKVDVLSVSLLQTIHQRICCSYCY